MIEGIRIFPPSPVLVARRPRQGNEFRTPNAGPRPRRKGNTSSIGSHVKIRQFQDQPTHAEKWSVYQENQTAIENPRSEMSAGRHMTQSDGNAKMECVSEAQVTTWPEENVTEKPDSNVKLKRQWENQATKTTYRNQCMIMERSENGVRIGKRKNKNKKQKCACRARGLPL